MREKHADSMMSQACNELVALYQGTTFSRAVKAQKEWGFSPCAFFRPHDATAEPS